MSKFKIPILFAFLVIFPTVASCQDEPAFLRPVTPTGEEIDDTRLLTITDTEEKESESISSTRNDATQIAPVSEQIIDEKRMRFRTMQDQLQELTLLWEQVRKKQSLPETLIPPVEQLSEFSTVSSEPATPPESVTPNQSTAPNESRTQSPAALVQQMNPDEQATDSVLNNVINGSIAEDKPKNGDSTKKIEHLPLAEIGPIDRFSLATSLFATEHFQECLHTLDSINLSQLKPHESLWMSYLKAGCYRNLGELEEANRLYRRIVANPESDWLGTVSRWWLDQLQDRQKLEIEYVTLTSAIKQWGAAVDELTK